MSEDLENKPGKAAEPEAPESEAKPKFTENPIITPSNVIIGLLVVVILILALPDSEPDTGADDEPVVQAAAAAETPAPAEPVTVAASEPAMPAMAMGSDGIERHGEGRLFYTTIKIPANAETLYLSGSGAAQKADGTWGNMEEQAIDTFNKFKRTLESEGWSMSDIVQVRAFAVAGEYGLLDFDGFNRGYSRFFGTEENPNKPVRSFVQVADLVVDGWLVEIEIRAARVPADT